MNRRKYPEPEPPSLRDRLAHFLLLCGGLATISLVVIITQRLSDDALSMMVGAAIAAALMGALLVGMLAFGYLITRWTEARAALQRSPVRQRSYDQPPILIVNPAASDLGSGPPRGGWDSYQATSYALAATHHPEVGRQRSFTVIGGED